MEFAATYGLAETRVVSPEWRYSMRPGAGGWAAPIYGRELRPVIERIDAEVSMELLQEIVARGSADFPLFRDYQHEVWRRVAAETGLQYKRERR